MQYETEILYNGYRYPVPFGRHDIRNHDTAKPVCNDHLYNKFNYLWFIQKCVLMKIEGNNLLVLAMSAFWSSSRWPLAT